MRQVHRLYEFPFEPGSERFLREEREICRFSYERRRSPKYRHIGTLSLAVCEGYVALSVYKPHRSLASATPSGSRPDRRTS